MRGDVRRVADLDAAAISAWRDLAGRVLQPNPLFEPDCLVPASRHLANGDEIVIVFAEEAGRWYGCFPVQTEPGWRAIRRPVLLTKVRRMTYDGVPLLDTGRSGEAMAAMLLALERPGLPGITVFEWLDDGPVAEQLTRSAHALGVPHRVYHRWERPVVRRTAEGDYRGRHSKKWLRNQDRMLRRMGEELGGVVQLRDRSDDVDAVDLLLDFEAAGHKGRNGVAVLTQPGEAAWFREMCDRFRAIGRLHVYALSVGERTVALLLLLRGGNGLFALKMAYEESLARFSPGNQLHLAATDHVHATTDVEWIDTCTYEGNETLLRFYPDRRSVSSTLVAGGGLGDRVLLRAVTSARTALGRSAPRSPALPARPAVDPSVPGLASEIPAVGAGRPLQTKR